MASAGGLNPKGGRSSQPPNGTYQSPAQYDHVESRLRYRGAPAVRPGADRAAPAAEPWHAKGHSVADRGTIE